VQSASAFGELVGRGGDGREAGAGIGDDDFGTGRDRGRADVHLARRVAHDVREKLAEDEFALEAGLGPLRPARDQPADLVANVRRGAAVRRTEVPLALLER